MHNTCKELKCTIITPFMEIIISIGGLFPTFECINKIASSLIFTLQQFFGITFPTAFLCAYKVVNAQQVGGTDFYVGIMRNYLGGPQAFQLYITTLSTENVTYTIEINTGVLITGNVSSSSPQVESLSTSLTTLDSSYTHRHQGVHVYSDGLISLLVLNYKSATIGEYPAYPYQAYPIFQYQYYAVATGSLVGSALSEILLVGNEDDTSITITPTLDVTVPTDIQSESSPSEILLGGTTKLIKLNRFQTFLFGVTEGLDISGTSIVSDKPLTVVSGNECGNIPSNIAYCEHVAEQIPPTVTWGKKYLLAPYKGRTAGQYFKLIASEDLTTVKHNCNLELSTIFLSAGEVNTFFTSSTTYCYLESDKPLLVTQMTPGGSIDSIGDPAVSVLPSIEQYDTAVVYHTPSLNSFSLNYINIVTREKASIEMDGTPLNLTWTIISNLNGGIGGYAAQVDSDTYTVHIITSKTPFSVLVYGFGSPLAGYSYSAGIGLQKQLSAGKNQ